MTQQRRVRPAVGVAAVGLGIGAGALGLYQGASAEPPRPATVAAPSPARLLAEGRELVRQNRLGEALTRADAAVRLGDAAGADTLRREVVADGKQQIEELTAQAKVLAGRGDGVRSKASLDLARQIATEIGLATAPPPSTPVGRVVAASPPPQLPSVVQAQGVVFRPADPPAEPLAPPPIQPTLPVIPPPMVPVVPTADAEKPLLPAPPVFSLTPSGPTPPAVPVAGGPPAPGATPVNLPTLAAVAALAAAPMRDAAPKPGPGAFEVARPLPLAGAIPGLTNSLAAPASAPRENLDALRAEVADLKDFKRQIQDLLQGKADGTATGVDAGVLRRLTDLERKIEGFEKSVEAMRATLTRLETASTSQKPAAPAVKAVVRLVNDYPNELSLILNGTSYRLKAGETKSVDVPPGNFVYELIADGARPITRAIRDDETVTLRIK